jgi:hypothetical protein
MQAEFERVRKKQRIAFSKEFERLDDMIAGLSSFTPTHIQSISPQGAISQIQKTLDSVESKYKTGSEQKDYQIALTKFTKSIGKVKTEFDGVFSGLLV